MNKQNKASFQMKSDRFVTGEHHVAKVAAAADAASATAGDGGRTAAGGRGTPGEASEIPGDWWRVMSYDKNLGQLVK